MNLVNILYEKRNVNSTALKYTTKEITYKDLWSQSYLLSQTSQHKAPIAAILIDNSIEFVISLFSILIQQKSALLISPETSSLELNAMISTFNLDCIYTTQKHTGKISHITKENITIIYTDSLREDNSSLSTYSPPCNNGHEVAVIIPTSGTTSQRKYVQLTHKNIMSNILSVYDIYKLKENERELLSLPMTSAFCLTVDLLTCLYAGMTILIYDGIFSAKRFLHILETEEITYIITVPSVLKCLCKLPNFPNYSINSLKRITIGGEASSLHDLNLFKQAFTNTIIIYGYGMTECAPVITTKTYSDYEKKPLSVGKSLPNTLVEINTENGEKSADYTSGEILVKGPNVMKGYYGDSKPPSQNGWFHTGDIGYLDEEGYLYITGRKKNVIITAGKNIYPEEIESLIANSGMVKEIRVRGISDPILNEVAVADVVPNDSTTTPEQLFMFCKRNLPPYKIPKNFYFCHEIEKTNTNKIKRI